jgi:hypothetical protein
VISQIRIRTFHIRRPHSRAVTFDGRRHNQIALASRVGA